MVFETLGMGSRKNDPETDRIVSRERRARRTRDGREGYHTEVLLVRAPIRHGQALAEFRAAKNEGDRRMVALAGMRRALWEKRVTHNMVKRIRAYGGCLGVVRRRRP